MKAPRLLGSGEEHLFQISNSLVAMFIVAAALILFAQLATRKPQLIPSGLQNFAEWVIESLIGFLSGIMGDRLARKTFWFFATVFILILSANWFGLLPGVGSIGWGYDGAHGFHVSRPILRGANADFNMTFALAVAFFALWIIWSLRANGVKGFLSHIFVYHGDASGLMRALLILIFFLVGFLEVISIMIRPVSLTFRLVRQYLRRRIASGKNAAHGWPLFWLAGCATVFRFGIDGGLHSGAGVYTVNRRLHRLDVPARRGARYRRPWRRGGRRAFGPLTYNLAV